MKVERPILVVDDNYETRDAILHVLAFKGYPVVGVRDGRAALEFLHEQPASLVILDLAMPVMSGAAFLRARSLDPALSRIPVVVYSAHRTTEEFDSVCGYAAKHDDPDRLLELVERCRLSPGLLASV